MFPSAFVRSCSISSQSSATTTTNTPSNTANSNQSLNVFAGVDLIAAISEQSLPSFERPILASIGNMTSTDERKLTQLCCKEEIIKWLISVLLMDATGCGMPSPRMASGSISSSATSGVGSSIPEHYATSSASTIGTLIASIDPNGNGNRFNDQEKM